jgi:hypothetical protein
MGGPLDYGLSERLTTPHRKTPGRQNWRVSIIIIIIIIIIMDY